MGQYWLIGNITKKEKIEPMSFRKLMEWCYVGNTMTNKLINLLQSKWKDDEIVIVGDYTKRKIDGVNLYTLCEEFKQIDGFIRNPDYRYIYNHKQKKFIDMFNAIKKSNDENLIIHPLPLLLAGNENGMGVGDYSEDYFKNTNLVGSWVDDSSFIEITSERIDDGNYIEFIPNFIERCIKQ